MKATGALRPLLAAASGVLFALLPAFGLLLLAGLSQQQDAGHGFSLLAALVTVGYAGHVAARVHRRYRSLLLCACSVLVGLLPAAFATDSDGPEKGYDAPSRPKVVFGSFFVLLSGLGGWVGAGPPRGPRAGTPGITL